MSEAAAGRGERHRLKVNLSHLGRGSEGSGGRPSEMSEAWLNSQTRGALDPRRQLATAAIDFDDPVLRDEGGILSYGESEELEEAALAHALRLRLGK